LGLKLDLKGSKETEVAKVVSCSNSEFQLEIGKIILRIDPDYYRPTEVDLLVGDPKKAQEKLNWKPSYDLNAIIKEMVASDLALFKKELDSKNLGHKVNLSR
jgi:GDPmannose 4,6-dehydratase